MKQTLVLLSVTLLACGERPMASETPGNSVPEAEVASEPEPEPEPRPETEPEARPSAMAEDESAAATGAEAHRCLERARAHAVALAREPADENDLPSVEPGATFRASSTADLDGDGICELDLTPSTGRWNKVWPHLLYLSRDCSFAGDILAAEIGAATTSTRDHRDLEGLSSTGCAGWDFVWNRYTWDGTRYQTAETVRCCLPEQCDCDGRIPEPRCRELMERVSASCPATQDESAPSVQ
ncbi:MAG: hypothetical protein M3Y87_07040 [Myxococcota bacterium]|nr:hypothetical protein [Myxococcota bacterium]